MTTQGNDGSGKKEETSTGDTILQLQSKLKEVMCTNLCMIRDYVDKIFFSGIKKIEGQGNWGWYKVG